MFLRLLWLHEGAGGLALVSGPVSMMARKGGLVHRRAGTVYGSAIMVTSVSALVLAVVTRNMLLLTIAVFSFFLVFSGWRAPSLRLGRVRWFDWASAITTLLFSLGLLILGPDAVTTWFFGLGGAGLAGRELWHLAGHGPAGDWVVRHVVGMGASYIATVSAFAVVTLTFLPPAVAFIGPTLLGLPLIIWVLSRLRPSGVRTSRSP